MKYLAFFMALLLAHNFAVYAQHSSEIPKLNKRISLNVEKQRLGEVLDQIALKGSFHFSYSGSVFNPDSLVSIRAQNELVRDILDRLFEFKADYRESNNYVILRSAALRFSIQPEIIKTDQKHYLISGYVIDEQSGKKVSDASIYEKRLLESALSDQNGYFRMRIKGNHQSVILTVSKEAYRDTSLMFLSTVTIKPEGYTYDEESLSYASNLVERLGIGKFLVSARQRIQSLNISGFLANSRFQASLVPGLSSHGIFSSQVVNKASLNLLGGYTAGLDGAELAGLFNISKNDVRYVQLAGLSNVVGGSMQGFQAAGLFNSVLDSLVGFQAAGLGNDVRKSVGGWQAAGVFNHVRNDLNGMQVAGVSNLVSNHTRGLQIAGIGNITRKEMRGIQIGGVFNYSKNLKGLQIGLINIADTSSGFSLGLINWVSKGYHKLSLASTDVFNQQLAIKSGNPKLYSMLIAAGNFSDNNKIYSAGYGLGHHMNFNKWFSGSAELTAQGIYVGYWDYPNILSKAQLNLQFRLIKGLSLFAGPSYSLYRTDPLSQTAIGYKKDIAPASAKIIANGKAISWTGWTAGINLF